MSDSKGLFSPVSVGGLSLKNRITMAPMFLGYADAHGMVSPLMLGHYREMAASGAALVVVENAAVDPTGMGSPAVLRVDNDRYLPGLAKLSETIHAGGAAAFLQINHAGRYAFKPERVAPSPYRTGDVTPRQLTKTDIKRIVHNFAEGARRVKEAGFDGVEVHGGTGYLIVQFLSKRTNARTDEFGGEIANRMRFGLMVVDAVRDAVGRDFLIGYRFLADELLPEGLHTEETAIYAKELKKRGVAYLSVTAGTYDSFFATDYKEMERKEAYMAGLAGEIKKAVGSTPVIAAGRIQTPETAEKIIADGTADMVGLARVLFADPLWPKKASGEVAGAITACKPTCSLCMKRVMTGRPLYCAQWPKEKREAFLKRIGEKTDTE